MTESFSPKAYPPEHYVQPLEHELGVEGLYDPQEEALKALIDGAALIPEFVEPDEVAALANFLSSKIKGTDTGGTVVFVDDVDDLPPEAIIARGELADIVRRIVDMYVHLVCTAADIDPLDIPRPEAEVIKYFGDLSMEWHTDNYEANDSFPSGSQHLGVLNGVITLSGNAKYSYKDPETGEVITFDVGPGTLVISRSGDLDDMPQVEHMVSPPDLDKLTEERVALLITVGRMVLR